MNIKHKAIHALYEGVNIAIEDPNDVFIVADKNGEVVEIDMSAVNAKVIELQEIEDNKVANKASGNTKLLNLGLTQEEATAMTGYKPE